MSEERAMLRRRHVRDIMLGEPDTIEPDSLLGVIGDNPAMAEVARDARRRLEGALQAIG